jgi:lipopolysaccharide biosynthesis glycosyltransferase
MAAVLAIHEYPNLTALSVGIAIAHSSLEISSAVTYMIQLICQDFMENKLQKLERTIAKFLKSTMYEYLKLHAYQSIVSCP